MHINKFDLSSEGILSIPEQPSDTCDYNHPIHFALEQTLSSMNEALSNEALSSSIDVELNEIEVQNLVTSAHEFEEWLDGWVTCYENFVVDKLKDNERIIFDTLIKTIKDKISMSANYKGPQLSAFLDSVSNTASEFEKDLEKALEQKKEVEDEIESLVEEITLLERELEHASNEDSDYIEEAISSYQAQVEDKEAYIEATIFEDAQATLNSFEEHVGIFGSPMQGFFTELRRDINHLKGMLKDELMTINRSGTKTPILTYPTEYLRDLLVGHDKENITIVAACKDVFIEKVIKMEFHDQELTDEDRHKLINGDIKVALKKIKLSYPHFEKILWFSSLEDSLKLGRRKIESIDDIIENIPKSRKHSRETTELSM